MARQDWADGGFIGKVGNVVGQHWHNIRYVRNYVKPKDPKTDKQIAARNTFARATKLAQEAMQVNGKNGIWDNPDRTEFQARVKYAASRLFRGESEESAFPLYPENYTPQTELQILSIDYLDQYDYQINFDPTKINDSWRVDTMIGFLEVGRLRITEDLEEYMLVPNQGIYPGNWVNLPFYQWPVFFAGAILYDIDGNPSSLEIVPFSGIVRIPGITWTEWKVDRLVWVDTRTIGVYMEEFPTSGSALPSFTFVLSAWGGTGSRQSYRKMEWALAQDVRYFELKFSTDMAENLPVAYAGGQQRGPEISNQIRVSYTEVVIG